VGSYAMRHSNQPSFFQDSQPHHPSPPSSCPCPSPIPQTKPRSALTNPFNLNLNSRTQNLIPAVDTPYQPSTPLEAASAAEGMREGGVWCEVFFYGGALGCWWGLCEEVDYVGDIGLGVFHCVCGGVVWGGVVG